MSQVVVKDESVLEPEKKLQIENSFSAKNTEITLCNSIYQSILSSEMNEDTVAKAADLKKRYAKIRNEIERIHKSEKHFYLKAGQYVDAYRNKLLTPLQQIESTLDEISNHFINLGKERLENLRIERTKELLQYLEKVPAGLENLDDQAYSILLEGAKVQKEKRDIEEKAEIKRKKIEARVNEFKPYMYLVPGELDLDIECDEYLNLKQKYEDLHVKEQKRLASIAAKAQKAIAENKKLKQDNNELKVAVSFSSGFGTNTNPESSPFNKSVSKNKSNEILKWIESFQLPDAPIENEISKMIIEKHQSFIMWSKSLITV